MAPSRSKRVQKKTGEEVLYENQSPYLKAVQAHLAEARGEEVEVVYARLKRDGTPSNDMKNLVRQKRAEGYKIIFVNEGEKYHN